MAQQTKQKSCVVVAHARLISLNGGIVLAVCIVLSSLTAALFLTERFAVSQAILFVILMIGAWIYLIDGASEKLSLQDHSLVRSSRLGRELRIKLVDVSSLVLRHEGLNPSLGIESLTIVFRDGHEERIPLGPCWRRRDLESFLSSVEEAMGYEDVVESVR
ncbi:hypothetical protein KJZ71_02610 [Patescibacteria group bacterium]|uniref:Uncharacterized protein n=1 Tax=candidate division WWE3 bacterium TaxID=2053526 RepID=A0A928Y4Q4_UNCKA|nr:hypothetical protein [candidate division WWE3 bacterium]MCL4732678.1 hypothetical protein [Patescibacteria group bacterium]